MLYSPEYMERPPPLVPIVSGTFQIYLSLLGVFFMVLGFYTRKLGGMPWKRLSTERIVSFFALGLLGLTVFYTTLWWITYG
jgi:hypothetical protein